MKLGRGSGASSRWPWCWRRRRRAGALPFLTTTAARTSLLLSLRAVAISQQAQQPARTKVRAPERVRLCQRQRASAGVQRARARTHARMRQHTKQGTHRAHPSLLPAAWHARRLSTRGRRATRCACVSAAARPRVRNSPLPQGARGVAASTAAPLRRADVATPASPPPPPPRARAVVTRSAMPVRPKTCLADARRAAAHGRLTAVFRRRRQFRGCCVCFAAAVLQRTCSAAGTHTRGRCAPPPRVAHTTSPRAAWTTAPRRAAATLLRLLSRLAPPQTPRRRTRLSRRRAPPSRAPRTTRRRRRGRTQTPSPQASAA